MVSQKQLIVRFLILSCCARSAPYYIKIFITSYYSINVDLLLAAFYCQVLGRHMDLIEKFESCKVERADRRNALVLRLVVLLERRVR